MKHKIIRVGSLAILGASQLGVVCHACTQPEAPICREKSAPAREALTEETLAKSGRRMIPLEVRGETLTGRTPQGEGAPYIVMSGTEELWRGGPDTPFRISAEGLQHIYLLSSSSNNLAWQQLKWEGTPPAQPAIITRQTLKASKHGITPGSKDASPGLRRLLSQARKLRHEHGAAVTIELEPGDYHLYPEGTLPMSLYISNHDQQDIQPVGLPLADLDHVTIDGKGARLICHGLMLPVLLMDSRQIRIKDLSIDYITPFYVEGKITEANEKGTTVEIPAGMAWKVREGKFYICGEGWEQRGGCGIAFKPDGRMVPLGTSGDLNWPHEAEITGANQVRFTHDASKQGLSAGDIITIRNFWRPHPAMVIYRSQGSTLDQVIFRNSQGMALLAQRSEDITIKGGGCVRHNGRMYTVSADATHFSNCRGHIDVEEALYEGMMDDAINIHSTCLRIEEVLNPREIICRYVHPQAIGFEVFLPGETVQYIHGRTLQNTAELGKVDSVTKINETTLRITLAAGLPAGIGKGDAVENADWYPSVTFRGNTVRHNRARGALFTTPKTVLVENNRFDWSSGSAILLAGDAQGWYESGRCLNVTIRGNHFENNLTCRFQFTEGIISICPEIRNPEEQTEKYHQNILIENNTFITHRVPLVYAISVKGLTFRDNQITYHDDYAPMHDGQPYIFRHCEEMQTQDVPLPTPSAAKTPNCPPDARTACHTKSSASL